MSGKVTFKKNTFIKGDFEELKVIAKSIEEKFAKIDWLSSKTIKTPNHLWYNCGEKVWRFGFLLNHQCDHELTKKELYKAYGIEYKEADYDLDFYEALKIVMDGGCVKGNNFVDGIYLKLNSRGQLVTVDACRLYVEETNVFILGMKSQKFRELTVMTMKELSR